jgi:SAM-dependent methyltransferase
MPANRERNLKLLHPSLGRDMDHDKPSGPLPDGSGEHPLTYPSDHDRALSILLDATTRRRIEELVELDGMRVLEVGAGGGSIAAWMARHVGPNGRVSAIDRRPRFQPKEPRLTVQRGDIVHAELPTDLDFIHARLTLAHIPQRRDVFAKLVRALRPGGYILIEDWWAMDTQMVLNAPTVDAAVLYGKFQEALGQVFANSGTDRNWARAMHAVFLAHDLTDVRTTYTGESWSIQNGAGFKLMRTTVRQSWNHLVEEGMTENDLKRVLALLNCDELVLRGHPLYSTSGVKPNR